MSRNLTYLRLFNRRVGRDNPGSRRTLNLEVGNAQRCRGILECAKLIEIIDQRAGCFSLHCLPPFGLHDWSLRHSKILTFTRCATSQFPTGYGSRET